ncbi:SMC-Scp complex subunit ScpB [Dyella sp. KRB-257]|uniref:SMC-Scp complex subunit ScpB n=1 Tax=Dyella sp. KRB-257 TaxID=3400915 RepID=UPI003C10339C
MNEHEDATAIDTDTALAAAVRAEPLTPAQLKPIVEAALLASSHPLAVAQLVELFGEEHEVTRELIARVLEALAEDCAGRGIELKEVASGFRYQVRQDVHPRLSRMWTERPSRYSRALLETLALIAYRQPITRPEIEQIRGVVVSSNIIKTMEERDWIRVVGHRDVPGKPALFGTTRAFLDYFNLKSLDELPPLSEIRDMEDPQLRFEPEPLPARVIKNLSIDPEADAEAEAAAQAERHDDDHDHPAASTDADEPATDTDTVAAALDDLIEPADPVPTDTADGAAPEAHTDGPATADEAANPAHADHGDADKNPKESRA